MPNKAEIKLRFRTDTSLGVLTEFLSLAVSGGVSANKVRAQSATYSLAEDKDLAAVEIVVQNSKQRSAADFNQEITQALCAISLIGGKDLEGFGFSKSVPIQKFYEWFQAQDLAKLSNYAPFDASTNLTLVDLENIFQALSFAKQPVDNLVCDSKFTAVFPYANVIAGKYESLRHSSGCEVFLDTRKDGVIIGHRIDAPDPVRELMSAWRVEIVSIRESGVSQKPYTSIFDIDGYRGNNESRWRISKMLGGVPPEHKQAVFEWAANAIYDVEEFHSTRGGVQLPETFQYRVNDVRLTADRNLKFHRE